MPILVYSFLSASYLCPQLIQTRKFKALFGLSVSSAYSIARKKFSGSIKAAIFIKGLICDSQFSCDNAFNSRKVLTLVKGLFDTDMATTIKSRILQIFSLSFERRTLGCDWLMARFIVFKY